MDGRNSSGARISLLNDDSSSSSSEERPGADRRAPTSLAHSRTSSFASTPVHSSPPTPQLVRSDSSDSATMQRTPSPITPINFGFDPHAVAHQKSVFDQRTYPTTAHASFFPPSLKDAASSYPQIGQHSSSAAPTFAYAAAAPAVSMAAARAALYPPSQQADPATSQQPQQQSSAPTKQSGKKNQYPCPLAKEYSCSHFFTTSGHAARHAKKHTGKKDAFCPECNKAFTRKDNMEQHRRTHQNGRNASKSSSENSSSATNKRQKTSSSSQSKRSKPPPLQASTSIIDPSLPISPASSYGYSDAGLAISGLAQNAPQVYPPELLGQAAFASSSPYPLGPYYDSLSGLDKLAMAASGEGPRQGNIGTF